MSGRLPFPPPMLLVRFFLGWSLESFKEGQETPVSARGAPKFVSSVCFFHTCLIDFGLEPSSMLSLHDVLVSAGGLSKSVDFCESLGSTSGCSLPDLLAWLLKPVLGKPELLLSGPLFTGVTVLGDPLGVTGCSAPFPLPFAGSDFTMADQEDFIAAEVFARVSACWDAPVCLKLESTSAT